MQSIYSFLLIILTPKSLCNLVTTSLNHSTTSGGSGFHFYFDTFSKHLEKGGVVLLLTSTTIGIVNVFNTTKTSVGRTLKSSGDTRFLYCRY